MKLQLSKPKIYALAAILSIALFSCNKIFETTSEDVLSPDKYYKTINDANNAVLGVYSQLFDIANKYIILNEVRADLIDVTENADIDLIALNEHRVDKTNKYANPSDFYKIINNCNDVINNLKLMYKNLFITKEQFEEVFQELEIILLENNVAVEVVEKIKKDLENSIVGMEIKRDKLYYQIIESLKISILDVLIEPPDLIQKIKEKQEPYVILFFGINGSGKTTSIAKLAYLLKKNNISSVMAAADTFRAASIEQIKAHGSALGIEVIAHNYGSDPASVAFDAIQYAKKNHIKAVLIDTAGRMYTKQNLMKEMEKIVRVSKPDLKIFVGESITGNDATEQAKTFNETAGIDGIILTKADVDDKAGTILSVSYVTKKPIFFLGTGQSYSDLTPFNKKDVLKHLGLE